MQVAGLLGVVVPEEYGGPGADALAICIVSEELGRSPAGATLGSCLNADMSMLFMVNYGSEAQKRRWLPGVVSGDVIQCTALTEADSGSDAASIRTTAVRDGDHYVVNGSKTYISNGTKAHLIYLLAKTDPSLSGRGISMILVPGDTPGVTRRLLPTMGFAGGDTAEMFFTDVRVQSLKSSCRKWNFVCWIRVCNSGAVLALWTRCQFRECLPPRVSNVSMPVQPNCKSRYWPGVIFTNECSATSVTQKVVRRKCPRSMKTRAFRGFIVTWQSLVSVSSNILRIYR